MEQKQKVNKAVKRYQEEQAAIRCFSKNPDDNEARKFFVSRTTKKNVAKMDVPETVFNEMEG